MILFHVNNKGSDQLEHPNSLISTFVVPSVLCIIVENTTCMTNFNILAIPYGRAGLLCPQLYISKTVTAWSSKVGQLIEGNE